MGSEVGGPSQGTQLPGPGPRTSAAPTLDWSHPLVPGCQAEAGHREGVAGPCHAASLGEGKIDDTASHNRQRGGFPPKWYEASEILIPKTR